MVNQGAITQCLPTAPLPICDSRQNPRVLVSEPRVWEEGNTPHRAILSSPHSLVCFSAPRCPRWSCAGQNWQKGSSTLRESREPQLTAPYPHSCLIVGLPAAKPSPETKAGE